MGTDDRGADRGGCGCLELRTDIPSSGPVSHAVWVRDVGYEPPNWEGVG